MIGHIHARWEQPLLILNANGWSPKPIEKRKICILAGNATSILELMSVTFLFELSLQRYRNISARIVRHILRGSYFVESRTATWRPCAAVGFSFITKTYELLEAGI